MKERRQKETQEKKRRERKGRGGKKGKNEKENKKQESKDKQTYVKTIYIYSEIVTIRKAVKYTKTKSEKSQKKGGEKEKILK